MVDNLQITRTSNRCDQCATKNIGCDRTLPSCKKCIKSNLKCTFTRELKKKNKLYFMDKGIIKFKQTDKKVEDKKTNRYAIVKEIRTINNPINSLFNVKDFYALHNILTILQYPDARSNNNSTNLIIKFSEMVSSGVIRPKLSLLPKPNINYNVFETILSDAVTYFLNNQKYCMLFQKENFDIHNKSEILKLAIWCSGIIHKKDTASIRTVEYFESELKSLCYSLINLAPTLQNLQALLIIIYNLHEFKWVTNLLFKIIHWCLNTAKLIGLPFSFKGVSKELQLQRQLAYCQLLFIGCVTSLVSFGFIPIPAKLTTSNLQIYLTLKKATLTQIITDYHDHDLIFVSSLIFSDFLAGFNNTVYCLHQLKNQPISLRFQDLVGITHKLILKQEQLYTLAITKLEYLYEVHKDSESQEHIKNIQLLVQVCNNFIKYFINSLFFYHSKTPLNSLTYPIMVNIVSYCKLLIISFDAIHPTYLPQFVYAFFSQPIVFLLRNQYLLDDKSIVETIYQTCLKRFDALNASQLASIHSKANAGLIKEIKSSIL